ncbi:hypothetical protein K1W54_04320 [Micromonospora sp. CPCC 205371]|nr:hypothetical protein [Micromonospora sp. CPCC 205371]
MNAKILRPSTEWPATNINATGGRLATVIALTDRMAPNTPRPRLDGNDPRHFEQFAAKIRAMSDADFARWGVTDRRLIAMYRELAS